MNKSELRKYYLNVRKNIIDRKNKEKEIFNRLINSEEYIKSKVIAFYYSLDSEVNTLELISYSLKNKKIILLPKVNGEIMEFYQIKSLDGLIKSNFGVMEPNNGIIFNKNNIDLIVVPGICFDKKRNRIGFGKGYYDKYLCNYYGHVVALCFEEQIYKDNIEISDTDIVIKKIITDKYIYS
jgi:5-formyltetrahydrofolate cyclo-ligase